MTQESPFVQEAAAQAQNGSGDAYQPQNILVTGGAGEGRAQAAGAGPQAPAVRLNSRA